MVDFLLDNPLLLLFLVVAIGYPLGRLTVGGSSLGVASVLFAGLAVGAFNERLKLPEIVYQFGLVLFVYTIGLSNGRAFFAALRRHGRRDTALTVGVLVVAAAIAVLSGILFDLRPALVAGLFAGSLTNTPALAGELEYLSDYAQGAELGNLLSDPVVGYSVAYPMGVIGTMIAIVVARRLWRIDYAAEARRVADVSSGKRLDSRTIRVTRPPDGQATIDQLMQTRNWDVVFGRLKHAGHLCLVTAQTRLAPGDLVTIVGEPAELDEVTSLLGERSDERLELDRSELDFRRIFVSNPKVVGHRLREFDLPQHFGAVVTRLRRGDVEFLPDADTVLEPGDRVRVVAHRENMDAVSRFFGDSYRALSEIDVLTFSLGLAAGLLLGTIPLPLPGGITLRLGLAGGPLLVALILGARDRIGPFVWTLPYSANLTLRQIGLILFLAGIGTRAGYAFATTVNGRTGIALFAAGATITFVTALTTLWVGYRLFKVPMGLLIGMLAGLQTQPAVLGFALQQTGDDLPNVGYAALYPIATIGKIIIAQVLLALLL